uniref:AP3-like protein n=1 Tax=Balanophora fungosa TaxID=29813 RepID=K7RED3_9MAGN|nr:AP3-like protein [Balanophora fungosa]
MARGEIQIKKIENATNRQVTYSKRKNGLFKKANELCVLCDARVSIIMFSGNNKLHDYISPSTTTKQIYDHYQRSSGIDLWSSHYERMQRDLKELQDANNALHRETRQWHGKSLDDLSMGELHGLEQDMDYSLGIIRDRKDQLIGGQTEKWKRKVKNEEQIQADLVKKIMQRSGNIVNEIVGGKGGEDPFAFVVDNGGGGGAEGYHTVVGGAAFPLRLHPTQQHHILHGDITTYSLLE